MADSWTLEYEGPTGATYNTTQAYLPANWTRATVTLRRRAPHTIKVEIPRWTHHRLSDFVAGRLWRLSRNGAYWQAGFLDAPSLVGYDPVARRFDAIALPGWGNAYALALSRGMLATGLGYTFGSGSRIDQLVTIILDTTVHGTYLTDTAWFPSGGRTIYTSGTTTETDIAAAGQSPLELLNTLLDIDAATWRAGINGSGDWTFKAGTTVDQTLTGSIALVDQANCQITDFRQDGSQIATAVWVASTVPLANNIQLAVDATAAQNILNVTSATGIVVDDEIVISPETFATRELGVVDSVRPTHTPYPQVLLVDNLAADWPAGTTVVSRYPGTLRYRTATAASSVRDAHHGRPIAVFDNQLVSTLQRDQYGATYLAAYNHVLQTATVDITDTPTIEAMLAAGLEPGDTISLTSYDQDLASIYTATAVKVQEFALELTPAGATRARLTLGDPRTDALAVIERQIRAARQAATAGVA